KDNESCSQVLLQACDRTFGTPNTMNSNMLVAKPWTVRNKDSFSYSSVSSSGSTKCASPTGQTHVILDCETNSTVAHYIKPVKQSKLLPMLHGLMTGSWPPPSHVTQDSGSREDERKRQLETL